jgi:hypothetical protein
MATSCTAGIGTIALAGQLNHLREWGVGHRAWHRRSDRR